MHHVYQNDTARLIVTENVPHNYSFTFSKIRKVEKNF